MSFLSESPRIEMDKSELRVNVALGRSIHVGFDLGEEKKWFELVDSSYRASNDSMHHATWHINSIRCHLQPMQSLYHKNDIVAAGNP